MNAGLKVALGLLVMMALGAAAFLLLGDTGGPIGTTDLVGQEPTERIVAPGDVMTADGGVEAAKLDVSAPVTDVPAATGDPAAVADDDEPAPQARIQGRVVDAVGRPVSGATVTFMTSDDVRSTSFFRIGNEPFDRESLPSVRTDIDGEFTVSGDVVSSDDGAMAWLRSEAVVVVTHPDYATRTAECSGLSEGDYDAGTIALEAGTRLVGRAISDVGQGLEGVRISAGPRRERSGMSIVAMRTSSLVEMFNAVETGVDGRFTVGGLPAGDAWVVATRDDRRAATAETVTEVGILADVGDLVLEPGEAIAGRVVTSDGTPIEGATVRVSNVIPRRFVGSRSEADMRAMGHEFSLRAETDRSGDFELPGLTPGTYTVHASADGFARGERANVSTGTRDTEVVLESFGSVLVTLRSRTDEVLVDGAEIEANDMNFAWRGGDRDEDAESRVVVGDAIRREASIEVEDVVGRYLVTGVGPDGTSLSIRAPGYALVEVGTPGASAGETATLDVELVPEIVVRGRVLDLAGEPIDDASVTLEMSEEMFVESNDGGRRVRRMVRRASLSGDDDAIDAERITARTDRNGTFELRGATAGAWEITADADGYARGEPEPLELVEGQSVDGLELAIEQGGVIFGLVSDADGEPVGSAQVVVERVEVGVADEADRMMMMFGGGDDGARRTVTTDGVGRYRAEDLAPGEYDVSLAKGPGGIGMGGAFVFVNGASGPTDDTAKIRTRVGPGVETRVDLVKPRGAVVEGQVLAAGQPVEGTQVTLGAAPEDGDPTGGAMRGIRRMMGGSRTATTDRFGYFVFEDVECGPEGSSYELSAKVAGAGLDETAIVDVVPGETAQADLVFEGSTLRGRIVDEDTGAGVPGLVVTVAKAEGGPSVESMVSFSFFGAGGGGMSMDITGDESVIRTDADGVFEVKFLEAGDYSVRTGPSAYVRADAGPFTVGEDVTEDDVVIEVARGAVIEGVVRAMSSGEPMPGVIVRLDQDGGRPNIGRTDEEGVYRFEGLEEGGYTVVVQGSGFGGDALAQSPVTVEAGQTVREDLDADDSQGTPTLGGNAVTIRLGG